jgi:serine/threonine protein kinase
MQGTLLDGTIIAVKQLSSKSKQGNREFVNEIGMISGLQHPNLVGLYGCCVERNQLLLVYEYMESNSLAHALFGKPNLSYLACYYFNSKRIGVKFHELYRLN